MVLVLGCVFTLIGIVLELRGNWAKVKQKMMISMEMGGNGVSQSQGLEVKQSLPDSSLAIYMVVIPFLRYQAKENIILEREEEYKLCLRKNLAHPYVQQVHLLTSNSTETQVRFKEFTSNSKLVISEVESINKTRDIFEYVSQTLLHKDVMVINADIYLGDGFDKINATLMDRRNIMYAISRHPAPEHIKCGKGRKNFRSVDKCRKYSDSHDTFLFRLKKPLKERLLQNFDFPYPTRGMEGRMIWFFKRVLKYCVLNPCSILETFHYHCSPLRTYSVRVHLAVSRHYTRRLPSKRLYCFI
jgi:hypothetical protein